MFQSLQNRAGLALLLLAVLPILGIGSILTARTYNVQEQQVIQLQEEVAQRVSQSVVDFVTLRLETLQIATQVTNIQTLSTDEQDSLLLEMLSYDASYDSIALLDTTGQELARVSRTDIVTENDLVIRDDLAFTLPLQQQETYIGDAVVDDATGQLVSTVSYPIVNPRSGVVENVVIADIRLGFLAPLLDEITDSTNIYVLNENGRVIAHPNSSVVLRETIYELPETAGIYQGLFNEDVVLAFIPVELDNGTVYVVAEQSANVALNLVRGTLTALGIALVVNLVLAVILAAFATRFVVRPLEELSQVATKIADGDLTQRAPVNSNDEIGVLAKTFNSMTDQLNQLINNLEQRIASRTRDLTIAAQVSQQVTQFTDLDTLLPNLAELTKDGFDLYHASVFVYDAESNMLELAAGSGKIGNEMVDLGKHFLLDDLGIVPLAARLDAPQTINDVDLSTEHAVNPLLPQTRSELALPMRVGTELIGVLDLQSTEVNHFGEDDLKVLTSLAEQIAIAIRNAQLFEETTEAQKEAEQANTVKSMFLASMSHELRTPLNAIINFTKFVSRGVMGPVTERQVETLTNVIDSGEHLLLLINDVLDISKIESGSLKLFMEENIDLTPLIDTTLATGKTLLADKPVDIAVDIDPALPSIECDKQRVIQILLNIVSNACKFTSEGTIIIHAKETDHNMVLFSVTDNGPGIAPEDYDAVFETFKQTNTGLRQGSGTGLGMPISKNLVEAHGGELWIESTVGEGATFHVTLPISQSKLQHNKKVEVTA